MRIGHSKLNSTLFIIGKHPTGNCQCEEKEAVSHVLTECRKYETERRNMLNALQRKWRIELDVKDILGCGSEADVRKVIFHFLTGLLKDRD